jgi:hypothetical protein
MAFHQRKLFILSMLLIASAFPAYAAGSGPSISTVSYPSNVTSGVPAILSATVSSSATVTSCNLYIDSDDKGAMTLDSGRASKTYLFASGGVVTAFVFCRDSNGGMAHGNLTSIFVGGTIGSQQAAFGGSQPPSQSQDQQSYDQTSTSTPSGTPPAAGSLIKLACGQKATADDPCKAVYYYGSDGKRHAFPNEKAFFT